MQVWCDDKVLDLPEDIEGLLLLNINSYMGGVDLWASGAPQNGQSAAAKQSFCDGRLEVNCSDIFPFAQCIIHASISRKGGPRPSSKSPRWCPPRSAVGLVDSGATSRAV